LSQRVVSEPSSRDLASIVQAGVMAPSADNRHCFELRTAPDRVLLFGDETYVNAPYHRRVLNLISFGAVVENMRIRAERLGYRMNVAWLPDAPRSALIAELQLTRIEPAASPLDGAISRRHTNRTLRFSGPRLSEADLAHFNHLVHGIEGVTLTFHDSGRQRARLLSLIGIAEAERFNTRALHEDLFSNIRFDVGWHASADEGLPPGALGVEPGARWAFAQLRRWPVMSALRHLGVHHVLGFRAAQLPCRLAPHRAALTTSLPVERGALSVGVALERVWLEAERRGLAFQPFAASPLLALREYAEVPKETAERLREGWHELTDGTPLMVFRLGHAKRPAVRTARRGIEGYLRH
jgi:hypothetical protein